MCNGRAVVFLLDEPFDVRQNRVDAPGQTSLFALAVDVVVTLCSPVILDITSAFAGPRAMSYWVHEVTDDDN